MSELTDRLSKVVVIVGALAVFWLVSYATWYVLSTMLRLSVDVTAIALSIYVITVIADAVNQEE